MEIHRGYFMVSIFQDEVTENGKKTVKMLYFGYVEYSKLL